MKIVIALDSFKGSCSAQAACAAVATGLRRVRADLTLTEMPVADGGEGLLVTLAESPQLSGVRWHYQQCTGPYGQPVQGAFLTLDDGTAIIEMAQSCGLELTPASQRDVRRASSYGLGEQVRSALDLGCRRLIIGLGGSATNDGGTGFAQALGARFWRADGTLLPQPATAQDLAQIARVDLSALDARLRQVEVQASCDVTNPLLGEQGATWIYGAQKGADHAALVEMEAGMQNYNHHLTGALGRDISTLPGTGAAGGMGAALIAFTGATLRPGIELVLELLNAAEHLRDASLVFVGEGWLDRQSAFGKAPVGVAHAAAHYQIPVIALCGGRDESSRELYQHHIDAFWSICPRPISLSEAMAASEQLLADAAENALRTFLAGRQQQKTSGYQYDHYSSAG
ncbi:glycerate kinase [[Erwinia] mediterraneensis]|uniref:glycerate kinase n=1 Tax=[Erwinia] mediterraneensis TaxID=2161819 RepID=UPI0010305A33|nr:glycerate kinase [[Erwinia] mediterraneensis]